MVVNLAGLEAAAKPLKGSSLKLFDMVLCFVFFFFFGIFIISFSIMRIYIPRESAGVGRRNLFNNYIYPRWSLKAKPSGE